MTERKHPGTAFARRYWVFAALFGLLGTMSLLLGSYFSGGTFVVLGALFGWLGIFLRQSVGSAELINAANDALARGKRDEARAALARIPAKLGGHLVRAAAIVNAQLALQEGDLAGAISHATRACEGKKGLLSRAVEGVQIPSGLGLRALAHALAGNADAARADIAAVRAHEAPMPDALARAALAECVTAARADDREAIRKCWNAERSLMLEQLPPRERTLARALSRLARAEKKSVYREPARMDEDDDPIRGWVSRLVPSAAAYVDRRTSPTAASTELPLQVSDRAFRSVGDARARASVGARKRLRLRVAVAMAVVVGVAIPLAVALGTIARDAGGTSSIAVLPVIMVGAAAIAIRLLVRSGRRTGIRLRRALSMVMRGDPAAQGELEALAKSRYEVIAGQAEAHLAELAERRGAFEEGVRHCDLAIGRATVSNAAKVVSHDYLLPLAIGERAFCLAALGRHEEADAELASLSTFRTYAFAARTRFRVRLAKLLQKRDLAGALALARERTVDLPLSYRDELLCDLLEATEGEGVGQEEWARIDAELREDPKLASWVEHFLPGARGRLVPRTRVLSEDELDEIDAGGHSGDAGAVHG